MSKPISAPAFFFNNLVAQAKACIPPSIDLKNQELAAKIEANAFPVLVALGAISCLRSYKTPLAAGVALYAVHHLKHNEIMEKIAPFAQKHLPLGDNQLGLLSLFIRKGEPKAAINSMLALMIVYLVSPWLGSKITATFIGFKAAQQLYQLSQKAPSSDPDGKIPEFKRVPPPVNRTLDFGSLLPVEDSELETSS